MAPKIEEWLSPDSLSSSSLAGKLLHDKITLVEKRRSFDLLTIPSSNPQKSAKVNSSGHPDEVASQKLIIEGLQLLDPYMESSYLWWTFEKQEYFSYLML